MLNLSEFGKRVLSELEELRVENVFAMLNTISSPDGDRSQVESFMAALAELVELGLVKMGTEVLDPFREDIVEKNDGLELVSGLVGLFGFDPSERLWTLKDGDIGRDRIPIVLATDEGVEEGFRILSERGYQWWKAGSTGSS